MRIADRMHVWPCDEGHTYTTVHDGECGQRCHEPPALCPAHAKGRDDVRRWQVGPLYAERFRGEYARSLRFGVGRLSLRLTKVDDAVSVEVDWSGQ